MKAANTATACHMIADYTPHGSVGSTASFYLRRPHPVFTNVPEVAPLKRQTLSVTPFTVTLADIENLTAYALSLPQKK